MFLLYILEKAPHLWFALIIDPSKHKFMRTWLSQVWQLYKMLKKKNVGVAARSNSTAQTVKKVVDAEKWTELSVFLGFKP